MPTPVELLLSLDLPFELVDGLNHAYFLHLVATDPSQVVPPGKSLLSMLSRPNAGSQSGDNKEKDSAAVLHRRVENMLHKAFWDEALQSLSDPLPGSQIARLKFLYDDIRDATTPIFPTGHPILVKLSSPIPPTSSPLFSALNDLREVLIGLKSRCAPARDSLIDDILFRLSDSQTPLPKLVVDGTKSVIEVAAIIKDDLSQFILGTMSESQLKTVIAQQAKESERRLVLALWGEASLKQSCQRWLNELEQHSGESSHVDIRDHWILRLVQTLSSTTAISCSLPPSASSTSTSVSPLPESPQNALPPPLLFTAPALFYIQNYIQALVIAASLRSLVRSPPSVPTQLPSQDSDTPVSGDFMQRIWTLLKFEIDHDSPGGMSSPSTGIGPGGIGADTETGTKLVNLVDEVIRASRSTVAHTGVVIDDINDASEARLRAAVDRTLRTHDPVFVLLQKRLMNGIRERLLLRARETRRKKAVGAVDQNERVGSGAPKRLRTGREVARGSLRSSSAQRERSASPASTSTNRHSTARTVAEADLVVKGFEDPVLVRGVREVLMKMTQCVDWVESAWVDVLTTSEGEAAG